MSGQLGVIWRRNGRRKGEDHRRDRKSEEGRAQGQPLYSDHLRSVLLSFTYKVPYVSVNMRFNQC